MTTYIHLAGIDKLLLSIKSAYGLLTKHRVKMAEYWPNFFCTSREKGQDQYSVIFTEKA